DALATLDPAVRKLYLSVVNLHRADAAEVEIRLRDARIGGQVRAHVVAGDRPDRVNSFEDPEAVQLVSRDVPSSTGNLIWEAPPLSASVLEIPLGP
ncbi:MAG TPA: alpha-L-arabinofuranosidase C-terminal domain-containing protein, partial [Chloroflexota bacterium]|nr:alpha-L-arabinofuranosidase C-terminal domain-containing protein [Chloroflexota bacterium]